MDLCFPNIYIGDYISVQNLNVLKEKGITHIINVAKGFVRLNSKQFINEGIKVTEIKMRDLDDYPINKHFNHINKLITKTIKDGGTVLVNCHAGVSRSVTVVCAYLVGVNDYSTTEALEKIKMSRQQAQPNDGFVNQLNDYEMRKKRKEKEYVSVNKNKL